MFIRCAHHGKTHVSTTITHKAHLKMIVKGQLGDNFNELKQQTVQTFFVILPQNVGELQRLPRD